MKRSLFSPPDEFSQSPFLAVLPVRGSINKLLALNSSLYARYEKVQSLQKELREQNDKAAIKCFNAEEAMLKQVLEWISKQSERQIF